MKIISLRWEMTHLVKLIIYAYSLNLKYAIYCFLKKPQLQIHAIGDSHALSLTNNNICTHYISAATAHNLIKSNSSSKSGQRIRKILSKIQQPKKKLLIMVLGEVDCRLHIYYQFCKQERKISIKKLISQTIKNYGEFLVMIRNQNFNLAVFNVFPPGEQPNIYKLPYYSPRKTRYLITKEFNRQLKTFCFQHKIKFIDIFDELVDKNGNRIQSYKLDKVHYNTKVSNLLLAYIREEKTLSQFIGKKHKF